MEEIMFVEYAVSGNGQYISGKIVSGGVYRTNKWFSHVCMSDELHLAGASNYRQEYA